jgi:hypothetical protein
MTGLVHFLAGAVTGTYAIAAVFFLKFWRRTRDRLFLSFATAFLLLAANQVVVDGMAVSGERRSLAYLLRVLGFFLILYAIVDKNRRGRTRRWE